MFRLAATFAADLTVSSGLRVPPLPPCRSYFRTAFVAAKHRKPPKIPVENSKNLNLPKNTRLPNPLPTKAAPPAEPSEPPPRPLPAQKDSRTSHSTRNQLLFAGFVSCGGFLWAAAQTNAETDVLAERLGSQGMDKGALFRAKVSLIAQEWRRWGNLVAEMTENLPAIPRSTIREAYISMAQKFVTASDADKVCWGICAINGAVFIAWQVPRLAAFMTVNFIHHPLSGRAVTLLTSTFSHSGFVHLLFNSVALLSFGAAAGQYLYNQQSQSPSKRLESTTGYHFLAFFVSAGLVASLASHLITTRRYDRAIASLSKMPLSSGAQPPRVIGSLGSSGAIYACVTLTALAYPDLKIHPIFIPFYIPIQTGVAAMVALDFIGLARGWRVFDHIAHLGGALFGVWYYLYGPRLWDLWREVGAYMFSSKPKAVESRE